MSKMRRVRTRWWTSNLIHRGWGHRNGGSLLWVHSVNWGKERVLWMVDGDGYTAMWALLVPLHYMLKNKGANFMCALSQLKIKELYSLKSHRLEIPTEQQKGWPRHSTDSSKGLWNQKITEMTLWAKVLAAQAAGLDPISPVPTVGSCNCNLSAGGEPR